MKDSLPNERIPFVKMVEGSIQKTPAPSIHPSW